MDLILVGLVVWLFLRGILGSCCCGFWDFLWKHTQSQLWLLIEIYVYRYTHSLSEGKLRYMTVLNIFCDVSTYQYLHNHFTETITLRNKTHFFWLWNFVLLGKPRKWKRCLSQPKQNPYYDPQIQRIYHYMDGSVTCFTSSAELKFHSCFSCFDFT